MCTTDSLHCDDAATLVDELDRVRRAQAGLEAERTRLLDELRRVSEAHQERIVSYDPGSPAAKKAARGEDPATDAADWVARSTRAEVACVLRVTERQAADLLRESRVLCADLPATMTALTSGEISYRHAAALVEDAEMFTPLHRGAFEDAVLAGRRDVTVHRFAHRSRRIREHLDPDTIQERADRAVKSRDVTVQPARDGMGWLMVYGPIMQVHLAHTLLTGTAKDEHDAGDPRTLGQLRFDALIDALLRNDRPVGVPDSADPAKSLRPVRVNVTLTVPALSLLGESEEPAVLDGYGPIPLDVAMTLAAGATSWRRVLTDPVTGIRLVYDRTTYKTPAALRTWLADRDGTCRFPGCDTPATGCETDHNLAWEHGGCTDHDNLAHLCKKHHRLKHHTRWTARLDDELLVWTSPTGHEYTTAGREDRGPALTPLRT
ncbi:hypothetical protein ASF40_18775 [Microbacterium sp. Leaf288]|uniref:HNH endonuclease signature motif containing protein n=1 Tax=Microbacterium sp. Leaf288 TaxID=1736323 RepID=UPI0006F245D4|nr:HNH endonuclease signature motif containing protein [Microbacterium sp. Leaf288]KQP68217.1 hypothetical protein ASF40_18775 [Microbacterium sp. Leaf288]